MGIQANINALIGTSAAAANLAKKKDTMPNPMASFEKTLAEGGINALIAKGYSQKLVGQASELLAAQSAVQAEQENYNALTQEKVMREQKGLGTVRINQNMLKSQERLMSSGQFAYRQREVIKETLKGGR